MLYYLFVLYYIIFSLQINLLNQILPDVELVTFYTTG